MRARCPYHVDCPTNTWDRDFTRDIEAEGMSIKKQLKQLPTNTVRAAVTDRVLIAFWVYFAIVAALCLVFR